MAVGLFRVERHQLASRRATMPQSRSVDMRARLAKRVAFIGKVNAGGEPCQAFAVTPDAGVAKRLTELALLVDALRIADPHPLATMETMEFREGLRSSCASAARTDARQEFGNGFHRRRRRALQKKMRRVLHHAFQVMAQRLHLRCGLNIDQPILRTAAIKHWDWAPHEGLCGIHPQRCLGATGESGRPGPSHTINRAPDQGGRRILAEKEPAHHESLPRQSEHERVHGAGMPERRDAQRQGPEKLSARMASGWPCGRQRATWASSASYPYISRGKAMTLGSSVGGNASRKDWKAGLSRRVRGAGPTRAVTA